jgi:hypothetical protein
LVNAATGQKRSLAESVPGIKPRYSHAKSLSPSIRTGINVCRVFRMGDDQSHRQSLLRGLNQMLSK